MFSSPRHIWTNSAMHASHVSVAIAAAVALTGCPLRDDYFIERTVAASGSSANPSTGGSATAGGDGTHASGGFSDLGATGTSGGTGSNGGIGDSSDNAGEGDNRGGTAGNASGGASGETTLGAGGTCTFGPFGTPQLVTGLQLSGTLWGPSLSGDGLTIYFGAVDGFGGEHIYRATRTNRGVVFSAAERIASLVSSASDGTPCVSADELTIYFYSTRTGGAGSRDLLMASRSSTSANFGTPTALGLLNTSGLDYHPWISNDERTLLYTSTGSTNQSNDVWIATRSDAGQDFTSSVQLISIDTSSNEYGAVLTSDQLTIYFASDRVGGSGAIDIWYATRTTPQGDFGAAAPVVGVNSSSSDQDPMLSRDDTELFFSSGRSGTNQLWRSVRSCL